MAPTVLGKRKSVTDLLMRGDYKEADPEYQQEIDMWILDYVIYMASDVLIDERNAVRDVESLPNGPRADDMLHTANEILQFFKATYPHQDLSPALKWRNRLAQFLSLFTRRLQLTTSSPSMELLERHREKCKIGTLLRQSNTSLNDDEGLQEWSAIPLSNNQLAQNQQRVLTELKIGEESVTGYYGSSSSITLQDLLPLFMYLIVQRCEDLDMIAEPLLLELAAEFMLQAALEQFLIYGNNSARTLRDCFSYRWDPDGIQEFRAAFLQRYASSLDKEELQDIADETELINDFFYEELDHEVPGWKQVREKFMGFLKPEKGMAANSQMELAASQHSIFRFEGKILSLLQNMLWSSPMPFFIQVENKQVEGLSEEASAKLLALIKL
ncbi:MAG: hypothetical protein M1821_004580 [Bathelium mastoideum]|nr:MAG: hypothetical protein M1821_004580 [Bathelium mastoideum]